MKKLAKSLKSLCAFTLFILLLWLDWGAARQSPHAFPALAQFTDLKSIWKPVTNSLRLRMVAVSRNELFSGELIKEAQFDWRLAWVPQSEGYISRSDLISGKIASTNIPAGTMLRLTELSKDVPGFRDAHSISVLIEIETYFASQLRPGMRLALVNSNGFLLLESALTNGPAFSVLNVNHKSTGANSSLVVGLPTNHVWLLTNMVGAKWRPVVISGTR